MFGLSAAGALVILALGKPVLWLFGEEFVAGYPVMAALAVGLILRAAAGPLQGLLVVAGEQKMAAVALGAATLTNLVMNLILIPRYGLVGAGMATSIAFGVESLLFYLVSRRILDEATPEPDPQEA